MKKIITMLAGAMFLVASAVSFADGVPRIACESNDKECQKENGLCKRLFEHSVDIDLINEGWSTGFDEDGKHDALVKDQLGEKYAKDMAEVLYGDKKDETNDQYIKDCCDNTLKYTEMLKKYKNRVTDKFKAEAKSFDSSIKNVFYNCIINNGKDCPPADSDPYGYKTQGSYCD